MPTTRQKASYNRRHYVSHLFRCRLDSDLADRIGAYKADGHSLNQLISILLTEYFETTPPMKYYTERRVIERWIMGEEDGSMRGDIELTRNVLQPNEMECADCGVPFSEAGKYYAMPNSRNLCVDCIEDFAVEVDQA